MGSHLEKYLSRYIIDLAREKGFKKFTEPQRRAIPHILSGKDTLIIAPTGSGKTEAAFLPILQMMVERPGKPIRTVYITPLRALNRDLIERLMWWANKLDFKISVRHGDTPKKERRIQSEAPPDILITTPETFSFLLNTRIMGKHLRNAEWIIVDEVHELVGSKRGVQLSIALERLRYENRGIQVIGLSATVGEPEKILDFISSEERGVIIKSDITKKISISIEYPLPTEGDYDIAEKLLTYPEVIARLRIINEYIDKFRSTLVFTNTRPMAEILGNRLLLYNNKSSVMVHHGSLGSSVRRRIERMLKDGVLKGIICTSSLELGIDIGDIDLVIQYGSPRQASKLLQRVGRSGHWIERMSRGIIISLDPDDMIESLVIRWRALRNKLEEIKIPEKPLDVLTHEVVGLLLGSWKISINELTNIIRRSIYYRNITYDELIRLLKYQSENVKPLIYIRSNEWIVKSRFRDRMYKYYFDNLSMIPETIQYYVVDDETNTVIGLLDEKFISLYGDIGIKFIMGGRVWRIIQIFKDKVFVKRESDPFGAVPDWVGEEIPVPYEVAIEVGRLKRRVKEALKKGEYNNLIERLAGEYDVKADYLDNAMKIYHDTYIENKVLPTDKEVVVEKDGEKIVIDLHGGTLVNRTIGSYIAYLLHNEYGEKVRYSSDQYRIFIDRYTLPVEIILNLLKTPKKLEENFKDIVRNSNVFKWRFVHVARRMGAIARERRITSKEVNELVRILMDTPIYEETIKECMVKDFDLENSFSILDKIKKGDIKLILYNGLLKATRQYLNRYKPKYEVMDKGKIEALNIASHKARILNKYVVLTCLDCLNYIEEVKIRDLNDVIKCPICGSNKIGFSEDSIEEVARIIDSYKRSRENMRKAGIKRLLKSSEIIAKFGKTGLFVLASEGITFKDAVEILSVEGKLNDRLVKLVIERSQRNLLRRILQKRRGGE